ncbi:unnamed protein product [Sphagnum balticum]
MAKVYRNGVCNLAACNGTDSTHSLFVQRNPRIGGSFTVIQKYAEQIVEFTLIPDWVNLTWDSAPLYIRGWAVQERFLSTRYLLLGLLWRVEKGAPRGELGSGDYRGWMDSVTHSIVYNSSTNLQAEAHSIQLEGRKFVTQKHFPRKGTADFVGCAQGPLFAFSREYRHMGIFRQISRARVPEGPARFTVARPRRAWRALVRGWHRRARHAGFAAFRRRL